MTLTPEELGHRLAPMVWDSFTAFIEDLPADAPEVQPEEILIFFLWLHTRACRKAFAKRGDSSLATSALDALHRSILEDLEAHGVGRGQLPLFEQRVSARYATYAGAAGAYDGTVAEEAARLMTGNAAHPAALVAACAEAIITTTAPLSDFLADVVLQG
jgi:hypothetical protein